MPVTRMKDRRSIWKRGVTAVLCAGLVLLCLLCGACARDTDTNTDTDTESATVIDTQTEAETEPETEISSETVTETETETETETLPATTTTIPEATCIDLSSFDNAMLRKTFSAAKDTRVSLCEDGVKFTATGASDDPQVTWNISEMYRAAGYDMTEAGNYVPFTPEEMSGVVFKVRASRSGIFELFYATGSITAATAGYSASSAYTSVGSDGWWYISLDLAKQKNEQFKDRYNDGFRMDWSSDTEPGDILIISEIRFFKNGRASKMYAEELNQTAAGATGYGNETPAEGLEAGYYVCLYQNKLGTDDAGVAKVYTTDALDQAKSYCDRRKHLGYRICDEKGNVVYTPYTLLQCDILREAKWVTTCTKSEGFTYGDAPINPAIDNSAKKVSCDRLVCWVLYRVGFTDQPYKQGVVVSSMHTWSEANGFIEITDKDALEPGDIILVRPNASGTYALHTFLYAGEARGKGLFYRYDHGSDERIQADQPQIQALELDGAPFWRAYRPVATSENNIYYSQYYQNEQE